MIRVIMDGDNLVLLTRKEWKAAGYNRTPETWNLPPNSRMTVTVEGPDFVVNIQSAGGDKAAGITPELSTEDMDIIRGQLAVLAGQFRDIQEIVKRINQPIFAWFKTSP